MVRGTAGQAAGGPTGFDPRWSRGTAGQAAGGPTGFLHDCRRTAARNLIRTGWRPAPGGVRSAIL